MKLCGKCSIKKKDCEFSKKGNGLASYCKECSNAYNKQHYSANKAVYFARNKNRNLSIRKKINTVKSNVSCICCNEGCSACLDLHHINDDKFKSIAMMVSTNNISDLVSEINKCVVICSNCHRKHHAKIIAIPSGKILNAHRAKISIEANSLLAHN